MIAALCVTPGSVYKSLPGVDAYDRQRDALSWRGGCPVVAHPPCRAFGRYHHRAKPRPGEVDLAFWCVQQVLRWGGVLEHPRASRLWPYVRASMVGFPAVLVNVNQVDWGHRALKPTTLLVVGTCDLPPMPPAGVVSALVENMCRQERERTPLAFAEWLVDVARRSSFRV